MTTEAIYINSRDNAFSFSPLVSDIIDDIDDGSFWKDCKWDYPLVRIQQQPSSHTLVSSIFVPQKKLNTEQQNQCKKDIRDLLNTAGKQNWDGEGADPVTPSSADAALKVVPMLPNNVKLPEISADPHGNVQFDWYLDNGTMFTISVGHKGDIAISGLTSEKVRLTGMEEDKEGGAHLLLQCGLDWLTEKT